MSKNSDHRTLGILGLVLYLILLGLMAAMIFL